MRFDVIGIGGVAVDLALGTGEFPQPDDKFPCDFLGRFPGGSIANATVACARAGLATAFAGWIGDDEAGRWLREDLANDGVDVSALQTVAGPTPFNVILVDDRGSRTIMQPRFAVHARRPDAQQLALLGEARVVLTGARGVAWCEQLRRATRGALALDVERRDGLQRPSLERVAADADIVFLSARALPATGADALAQIENAGWLIMTDGARGSWGIDRRPGHTEPRVLAQPAAPAEVRDSTGAGDCFHAAVIFAWLHDLPLATALRLASVAAALKIASVGARNGIPDFAELLAGLDP